MAYDITITLSNGKIRNFVGVTKIEEQSYNQDWTEIKNPLEFKFDAFSDYRFSNESTNSIVYTTDEISIIFIEVKKAETNCTGIQKAKN